MRSIVVLTGISTAEEPGMVGSGSVPGMEAGRGCLGRFRRCSSEDRDPGTGLTGQTQHTHHITTHNGNSCTNTTVFIVTSTTVYVHTTTDFKHCGNFT